MRVTAFSMAAALTLALTACQDETGETAGGEQGGRELDAPAQPAVDTTVGDTVAAQGAGMGDGADPTGAAGSPAAAGDGPGSTVAAGERLYGVQVAAFLEPQTAQEWTGRLQRQNLPAWTSMADVDGRTFYRVRVGASPSVSEARSLASLLAERYGWPVWVAPLDEGDRLPDDAVRTTRGLIRDR